jgi:hypothetical protein
LPRVQEQNFVAVILNTPTRRRQREPIGREFQKGGFKRQLSVHEQFSVRYIPNTQFWLVIGGSD